MKPKTAQEIVNIRESGSILATILKFLKSQAVVGITTGELADIASSELEKYGASSPFLHYGAGRGIPPFPSVICISLNDEVVHGIPGEREINSGDIVSLDFGVNYSGMITDSAVSFGVGKVPADVKRLLRATSDSLMEGIMQVRAGARVGDISAAVETRLRQDKLGVVEDLAGHGVGHSLHEEPWIPNFGKAGKGMKLKAGMTIAIEPMATLGRKDVLWGMDGWTITTLDGSLAAHFEHSILVTDEGYEVLTEWK